MAEHSPELDVDEAAGRAAQERSGSHHETRGRDASSRWRFDDAVQAARHLGSVTR